MVKEHPIARAQSYTSVASNKGNFIGIALSENNEIMMHNLEHGKRNAMCTSKTIENEIIEDTSYFIRERTIEVLPSSSAVFSIINKWNVLYENGSCGFHL